MIIEAALLTDDEKVTACTLAKAAGADYVKTSTGFGPGGATAADVALMRRVVGAEMGVKAAGGVRDLEGLKAMVAAGATRVGASAGVKIVQQARGETPARPPPRRDDRMLTIAAATAKILADAGIERVFGLPGGEVLVLIDELRRAGVDFVLMRHEANAGIAAAVYGKLRGSPASC